MYEFLKRHWVAGALFMSIALLALAPLLAQDWPLGLVLIFLHSPGYMIHQVEEHTGDRFRTFVNQRVFGGREALTTADVLWINVGAVWGIDLAALYSASFYGAGWALVAPYLMLVNAVAHIGSTVRVKGYNPGLVTGIVIFIPLSVATLAAVPADLVQHLTGLGLSLAVHAVIVIRAVLHAAAVEPNLSRA